MARFSSAFFKMFEVEDEKYQISLSAKKKCSAHPLPKICLCATEGPLQLLMMGVVSTKTVYKPLQNGLYITHKVLGHENSGVVYR